MSLVEYPKDIEIIINKNLPQLINNIKDIQISLYFDVLSEIVEHINVENFILDLLGELTKRILSVKILKFTFQEIIPKTRIKLKNTSTSSSKTEGEQYNIFVNKSLNIVRLITDKPEYVQKYIVSLKF